MSYSKGSFDSKTLIFNEAKICSASFCVDKKGNILVSRERDILVFTPDGKYLHNIERITKRKIFFYGASISFDNKKERILIMGNKNVHVLDQYGKMIFKFGSKGEEDGQFNVPYKVIVDHLDRIIVVDTNNHRVQVFNSDGKFLFKFGSY
jgi:hypothetical protein